MLHSIKKIIPKSVIKIYHYCLAKIASIYYGHPSEKMIVIGVTGTNGKTTTVRFIAEILKACSKKVGLISTAEIQVGEKYCLNDLKMTMPGRFYLQKLLKEMVLAQCEFAIIETSSQGIEQYRHIGINYDVAVFTNLTPEHIEAHRGFENYKNAKGRFFEHLTQMKKKKIQGKIVEKISVVNLDDTYASYFLQFLADKKFGYSLRSKYDIHGVQEIRAENIHAGIDGSNFHMFGQNIEIAMQGEYNIYNAMAALTLGYALGLDIKEMAKGLRRAKVPGRLEFIREGQNFTIIVDYAPEPEGLRKLYGIIKLITEEQRNKETKKQRNIIHVLGSCGGGRDMERRPIMGEIAGKNAQFVIVTNEDPYDDDPQVIIDQVAAGAMRAGKIENQNLFKILDRREAIRRALEIAQEDDLVMITGKGCEQAIVVANSKKIPWDDRGVVREELISCG